MAEIGRWNGHIFEVSASMVRSFSDLTIKAGCETEEKTSSKQKYVKRKAGNPTQLSLTIILVADLGCDVRSEADAFTEDARTGATDYFYVGSRKLVAAQLMLTDASVENIDISPSGFWSAATVKLTMKQAGKMDGDTGSSSGSNSGSGKSGSKGSSGSKKATVKTESYADMNHSQIAANNKYGTGSTIQKADVDKATDAATSIKDKAAAVTKAKDDLKVTGYYTTASGKKIPIMSV
ncbi:MAG: hypothetical protein IJ466_07345 [Clostridia bacterium]|nr:hypothetical protein [Clostridia bacterium]